MGTYLKNIEAITMYRQGFHGHITNNTFIGVQNIRKLVIKQTNIITIDKQSLCQLSKLTGRWHIINYQ